MTDDIFDATNRPLKPGQAILFASAGMFAHGCLEPGVVVRACHSPFGGGEKIIIRRTDRKVITLNWGRRCVILAEPKQETDAAEWLRRELSTLDVK